MLKRKYVVGVSLLAMVLVLGGGLFYYNMVRAQGPGEYNPWYDVTSEVEGVPDGKINIRDIAALASRFGTESSDYFIARAGLTYDSGWVNITDKAGQYFNITHNLNSTDIIVDITGKTTTDGGVHQRHLGLTGYTPGWSRTYGGPNADELYCIIQTSDGGYALVGRTMSFGAGGYDCWLIKTDVFGNIQWNKTYGRVNFEHATSLVETSDGGYALGGTTTSFGEIGEDDYWLVKVDKYGNEQWNQTYDGVSHQRDVMDSMTLTSDGGFLMAGTENYGTNSRRAWLVKTDSTGNVEWNSTYGTARSAAMSVIETSDGNYTMAGYHYIGSFGDFWLAKTYPNGTMLWNKNYGGANHDWAYSVVETSDGGYAIAGFTQSYGDVDGDFWLVKTDSSGVHQWDKTYGGTGQDQASFIMQTDDGGYLLAGHTLSFGAGSYDWWLVKTDSSRNMQWNKTYGGPNEDRIGYNSGSQCMVQTGDGGYIIAGWTTSFGAGDYDGWLVKTDVESGLAWTDSTADTITLYRGATDSYWNYVRVRIWKIKETP